MDLDVYRVVFNASAQLLWLLTPDGHVTDSNENAMAVVDASAAAVTGQPFWETPWWAGETAEMVRAAIAAARRGISINNVEIRTPAATETWWELSVSPLYDLQDTLEHILVECRDITPHHETIYHLQRSQRQLIDSQDLAHIGTWAWHIAANEIVWSDTMYEIFGLPKTDTLPTYEEYLERIHPDDTEPLRTAIREAYTEKKPYTTHHRVVHPDGTVRMIKGVGNVATDASGVVTRLYGVVQDVTERDQLEITLANTVTRLNTLKDMAQSMTAGFDREEVYRQIAATLRPLLGAEAVFVMKRDGDELVMNAVDQDGVGMLEQTRIPIATSSSGQAVLTGQSRVLRGNDALRHNEQGYVERNHFAPQAVISVPMWWQDKIIGVITATHRDPTAFTDEDVHLLEAAASWLAVGLLNVELWDNQQRAMRIADNRRRRMDVLTHRIVIAQEQERKRLARELHDESGQSLTALKISLDILQSIVEDPDLREGIREAAALTGDTMDHIRHISHQLRPPALDTFGLEVTLDGLCGDTAQRYGFNVQYNGADLPDFPEVTTIIVYRVVQEALANVARHASATRAEVTLRIADNNLYIEVSDDGAGFDSRTTPLGIGLAATAERLELLEGSFSVQSAPGQGTIVRACVPLDEGTTAPEREYLAKGLS